MTRCEECVYAVRSARLSQADFRTQVPTLECHRRSPSPGLTLPDKAYWPIVLPEDCCGDGEPIPHRIGKESGYLDKRS